MSRDNFITIQATEQHTCFDYLPAFYQAVPEIQKQTFFFQLKPFKPTLIPIDQDHLGMVPQALVNALEDWRVKCTTEGGGRVMPKLLYINPTGQYFDDDRWMTC